MQISLERSCFFQVKTLREIAPQPAFGSRVRDNKTVMVGDVALKWAPVNAMILVNKAEKHDSSISCCPILSLVQNHQRCISRCSTCRLIAHRGYGVGLLRLEVGKHFYRSKNVFNIKDVERQQLKRVNLVPRAQVSLAAGLEVINDLGLDTLTFLAATVLVVPAFKAMKASPILGFFLSGVILNQLGLIRNVTDIKALSELGILFLLFEMGLELSLARLRALAKFAFGLGLAQVLLCTLAFTAFELPPNGAIGTKILEFLFHSRPDLVNIRTIDEAVVIGAALAMSSSAFVLQLLAEKGELPTRFGSATLGILLFQDIAVVPLLVILPILESGTLGKESVWPLLAAESLKALGGLGVLSFGGQIFLRQIFEVVANSRSAEAFNALCILTVTGTSLATQKLGFSDTLGAFLAGALLAETNFRTQIEEEIRPFRGLLLGLFFVTTGTSIDIELLIREWPNVLTLLGGLIAIKTAIITVLGPRTGLSLSESVRIGLLLSQGGEFAFVVFSLANRLGVLPLELNRLLIIVVVLSMSLTPFLNELGQKVAKEIERRFEKSEEVVITADTFELNDLVVIIGFDQTGQVLANFLSTPLASGSGGDSSGWHFIAFDLDPDRVRAARKLGFPVLYGDGSRPAVLYTAGISMPKALMVMYISRQHALQAVERLRLAFPGIPIYARAQDIAHLVELKALGATDVILENTETSLQLGSVLLRGFGVLSDDVSFLTRTMRESMELRAKVALEKQEEKDEDWVKVKQTWDAKTKTKVSDGTQELPSQAGVTTSEVPGLTESAQSSLLSNAGISHHMPHSETELSSSQLEAVAGDPLLAQSETAARGHREQNSLEKDNIGAEHQVAEKMDKSENLNFCEPLATSSNCKTENSGMLRTEETKVSWYQKMEFSNYNGNSKLELKALDGHEDLRGVTWCALTNNDGFKDIS